MRKMFAIAALVLGIAAACPVAGCGFQGSRIPAPSASSGSRESSASAAATSAVRVWKETVLGTPIDIADSVATPGRVHIKIGASVTWVNHDKFPHNISVDNFNALSGTLIPPGHAFSMRFLESGTYHYRDTLNPVLGGEVMVQ